MSTSAPSVPTQMRGAFLPGNSTAVLRDDVPLREPGHRELLLKVGASGLCGSDIGFIYREHKTHSGIKDGSPAYKGVVCGHEPAGEVVAVGPGCRRFEVGDRVLLYHISGCQECANCRSGQMISCSTGASSYGWQRDGGNAEYLVAEEHTAIPLPDELTYVDGALIACGFGTAYEGIARTDVSGADELLVVGMGPVGLAAGMLGRARGARRVVGVEPNAKRRAWAQSMGYFDAVVAPEEAEEAVLAQTRGRGASVAIDCSGSAPGRSTAIAGLAEWGRLSLVGEGGRLDTEVSDALLHKQITIYASWVTSLGRMERLAADCAAWGIHPEQTVSDRFSLDEIDAAYAAAAGESAGKVVVLPNGALA